MIPAIASVASNPTAENLESSRKTEDQIKELLTSQETEETEKVTEERKETEKTEKVAEKESTEGPQRYQPDYTEIAGEVAKAVSGFKDQRDFYRTLAEKFEEVDGAQVAGKEVVVDEIELGWNSVYGHESELVFHLFYEAMEEEAKMTPVPVALEKIKESLEDREVEGSEYFLDIAVIKE